MSTPSQPRPLSGRAGEHTYEFEPPDVFHVHYVGDVETEHFNVFDQTIASIQGVELMYVLRDARRGGIVTAKARMHITRNAIATNILAVTYGASFTSQTIFTMMSRAAQTLSPLNLPAVFFRTEAEARAWIDEHRASRARGSS